MADTNRPTVNTRMPKGAKRPKTSRACLACRKLKARCESSTTRSVPADDPQASPASFVVCHRCKTLCIDCLYEAPNGDIVKGEAQPSNEAPPSASSADQSRDQRSSKRIRAEDENEDLFSNDRAVFLSPAITPSPLNAPIYRDIDISAVQSANPLCLERPTLPASALSRLIGVDPTLKPEAHSFLLRMSRAGQGSNDISWTHAPQALCAGKVAAKLLGRQAVLPPVPEDELGFLVKFLAPYESQLSTVFQGLYGPFTPFLSSPLPASLTLSACHSEPQHFVLLSIYLAALPHLEPTQPLGLARAPLRKAVDAYLRRAILNCVNDHLNILALHTCASLLLHPLDGLVKDRRPLPTPDCENDGLLQFAFDMNPRAVIIAAMSVACDLGYSNMAANLPQLRQSYDADSPHSGQSNLHLGERTKDDFAQAVFSGFTWITLLQFRASIDVAEERIEWDSLSQFEQRFPKSRIQDMTSALLPPPQFLGPREQSRCCWMVQRAELYHLARKHRHLKRSSASFTKKEAESQALEYKRVLDEWRFKFGEQMRSMSPEFRRDPRGLGLHRFYSHFSLAEATSIQTMIGSIYHKEIAADMRQRLQEPFYQDQVPWKSSAVIMLCHEEDILTKALLINLTYTDAMLKALGMISGLTPVMPQLYDFVAWEDSAGSEIPSLNIVALPNIQASLFAVPILAAAELRLPVIEVWGASAAHFNPYLLSMLTNCVKSLRASHVMVQLPGVLKMQFSTANTVSGYLQGPFEILMRKVAAAEERLQISHCESILSNSFLLSSKKQEVRSYAEQLEPDASEMVKNIADSHLVDEQITASLQDSLQVRAIQELGDTDLAVNIFGSDLRQGDVRPIRKDGRSQGSPSVASDADGQRSVSQREPRSVSIESEQRPETARPPTSSGGDTGPLHRALRSTASTSQFSSPASSAKSVPLPAPGPGQRQPLAQTSTRPRAGTDHQTYFVSYEDTSNATQPVFAEAHVSRQQHQQQQVSTSGAATLTFGANPNEPPTGSHYFEHQQQQTPGSYAQQPQQSALQAHRSTHSSMSAYPQPQQTSGEPGYETYSDASRYGDSASYLQSEIPVHAERADQSAPHFGFGMQQNGQHTNVSGPPSVSLASQSNIEQQRYMGTDSHLYQHPRGDPYAATESDQWQSTQAAMPTLANYGGDVGGGGRAPFRNQTEQPDSFKPADESDYTHHQVPQHPHPHNSQHYHGQGSHMDTTGYHASHTQRTETTGYAHHPNQMQVTGNVHPIQTGHQHHGLQHDQQHAQQQQHQHAPQAQSYVRSNETAGYSLESASTAPPQSSTIWEAWDWKPSQ